MWTTNTKLESEILVLSDLIKRFKVVQDSFIQQHGNPDRGFRGCGLGSEDGKPTMHVYIFSVDSPLYEKCKEMDDIVAQAF